MEKTELGKKGHVVSFHKTTGNNARARPGLLKVVWENLFHLKISNRRESWSISMEYY